MNWIDNKFAEIQFILPLVHLLIDLISIVIAVLLLTLIYYILIFIIGFIIDVLLKDYYSNKNMWKKNDTKVNENNVEHIKRYYCIWQRNRLKALKQYSHTAADNNKSIYSWFLFPFVKSIKTYINK
ncbi:hypothetical protein [Staphylococcus pettenkoferi]|uniref:hypothetical protein n=1 Tax=Staphylococcus pettenkoferi TaxID=170573 RepID=UPI002273AA76|nr:hypothetical protein [Staphylococcus pettenkoferi]MCY1593328.1 hypothetical protein [Staphylococcus pettenkoferi]MCY1612090.1 hypothetical protein [Staphylococcus pettenkoferi]MCY1624939.1 hypothetical protein [Staphylococcus pettenkoferi]